MATAACVHERQLASTYSPRGSGTTKRAGRSSCRKATCSRHLLTCREVLHRRLIAPLRRLLRPPKRAAGHLLRWARAGEEHSDRTGDEGRQRAQLASSGRQINLNTWGVLCSRGSRPQGEAHACTPSVLGCSGNSRRKACLPGATPGRQSWSAPAKAAAWLPRPPASRLRPPPAMVCRASLGEPQHRGPPLRRSPARTANGRWRRRHRCSIDARIGEDRDKALKTLKIRR